MEWTELRRKGLLTKEEVQMLEGYPGRVTLTLTSWAMQVVLKALDADVFWEDQKPHIAHVHNRLNVHMVNLIRSSNRVTYLLSNPVPFLYFHLMNSILIVNFFVLGVAFAIFKTWMTLAAYGFAVLVYTGMRQVSIDLSEPFEQDDEDFPVNQFLDYTFDHSVGLLEAFSHPDAYDVIIDGVHSTTPFSAEELVHAATQPVDYNTGDDKTNPFVWHKSMPFSQLGDTKKKHLKRTLTHLLVGHETLAEAHTDLERHKHKDSRMELLEERRHHAKSLREKLHLARVYLEELKDIYHAAKIGDERFEEVAAKRNRDRPVWRIKKKEETPVEVDEPERTSSRVKIASRTKSEARKKSKDKSTADDGARQPSREDNAAAPERTVRSSVLEGKLRPGEPLSSDEEWVNPNLLTFDEALLEVRAKMARTMPTAKAKGE
jgi:hypothetical protein